MSPSVVIPAHRIRLVDQRLDVRDPRVVLKPDQSAAGTAGGLMEPDLPIGNAQFLAALGAVDQRFDIVEIVGHRVSIRLLSESHQINKMFGWEG